MTAERTSLIAPHDVTVGEQQEEKAGDDANRIYDHSLGDAPKAGMNEQTRLFIPPTGRRESRDVMNLSTYINPGCSLRSVTKSTNEDTRKYMKLVRSKWLQWRQMEKKSGTKLELSPERKKLCAGYRVPGVSVVCGRGVATAQIVRVASVECAVDERRCVKKIPVERSG